MHIVCGHLLFHIVQKNDGDVFFVGKAFEVFGDAEVLMSDGASSYFPG